MTKIQKIWLTTLVAVPVIIEIVFQSTSRLVAGVITIENIEFGHKYTLVLTQSTFLLASAVSVFINRKQFHRRWAYGLLLIFLLLWAVVAYSAYYDALYSRISVGGY